MRREILDCGRAYWVTTDRHRDFAKWSARDQQPHLALRSSSTLTRDVRSNSSGGQTVTVMQATKSWHGYDSATHIRVLLWFTTRREGAKMEVQRRSTHACDRCQVLYTQRLLVI